MKITPSLAGSVALPLSACLAMLMLVACGGETPVTPSTSSCGGNSGDLFGTGFGGPSVFGFTLDTSTLPNEGKGVTLRVGERAVVRIDVGQPSLNSCRSFPTFVYMQWSWNWPRVTGQPQDSPVDVTVVSCTCRLFGDPYWNPGATGGTPHWEQRAWLDGKQKVELELRAISPGTTSVFVNGFLGPPYTTANPVIDHSISQLQAFVASVIP